MCGTDGLRCRHHCVKQKGVTKMGTSTEATGLCMWWVHRQSRLAFSMCSDISRGCTVTEYRQPLQVQSHLEVPRILVQLGHIQRT